jgi:NitT/TauT family transport system substrate-binding protein
MLKNSGAGTRRVALAAALALATASLAACASQTAAVNSNGTTSVVIGQAGNIYDLPAKLAVEQGYFAKEGIKTSFVTLTASTGPSALQSGSVQFLPASPLSLVEAVSKQLPIEAVSSLGLGNPVGVVVSSTFAKAHNLTSGTSAATAAKALKGSTAGYSSANTKAEASVYLRAHGISPSSINWVELPSPSAGKTALSTGQISWFATSEPIPLEIQQDSGGLVVADDQNVTQWSAGSAGYGLFTAVSESYAQSNPAVVKKVVAALQEATAYINAHPTSPAVLKALQETFPGVPDSVLAKSVQQVDWPASGAMSQSTWNSTLAFLTSLGTIQGGAKLTSSNWTNKYLP